MSTATLDTNVLASGFAGRYVPASTPGAVLRRWRAGEFILAVSEHIVGELARAFEKPYFARRLSPEERAANLGLLRIEAIVTPLTLTVHGVATHPADDLVLATAISAKAQYLVTGDAQLLRLGHYAGVSILSPRAFLDALDQEAGAAPNSPN